MESRANLRRVFDRINTEFQEAHIQTQLYTHRDGTLQTPLETLPDVQGLFTYNVDEETGSVTWEIVGNAPKIKLCSPTFQIQSENHCKTIKKMIAEYFTGEMNTDVSWCTIDPTITNRTTPDLIHQLGSKTWLVLGVDTIVGLGSDDDSPQKAYKTKFAKYESIINKIIQRDPEINIYFWVVIVGPTEVCTTFRLDCDTIDELVLRLRVGIAMVDVLSQLGLYSTYDNKRTDEECVVTASIASLATAAMSGHDNSLNEHSEKKFQNFKPDRDYINDSMKLMIEETKKLLKSKQENIDEMTQAFEKVERETAKMRNERVDLKAAVQMPFFTAQMSSDETLFLGVHAQSTDALPNVVDHVWREAYNFRLANRNRFTQLSLEQELNITVNEGFADIPDTRNNNWRKVDVNLSKEQKHVLALDGLYKRTYLNNNVRIQRRDHQQKGFSLSCDTTDIENCLRTKPKPCDIPNVYMEKLEPLLTKATDLAANFTSGLDLFRDLMSTDVALAFCQMSAIAQELAASLQQKVNYETWIFKKVLFYDIELLIKPTLPEEPHIFFLLRFRGKPIEKETFRKVHYHDGWWYTDLLSINESRLNNFIRAPALYLNTLIHFRINVSKMEKKDLAQISPNGYSETIAMLTLLIALEDKTCTEEMALNVRYLIMQFSKGADSLSMPRPGPVVLKIPTFLRSRLTVYLYKQIKTYCYLQWETLPEKLDASVEPGDHSADIFKNLLCPYTHTELSTFYDAVQVMYIAYAKNKDAIPEQNCDYGMIKKIAEHCLNVNPAKTNKYNGSEDPDPGLPGPHEFSPSFLSQACTLLKHRFKIQLGQNWMQSVETQIVKELVRATHHEALATMKASAALKVKSQRKCNIQKSCKCFEAVVSELEVDAAFSPSLIKEYTSIFQEVMSEFGGVCCYLFKKNQHGGLREIYVMTFKSRLLQLLPEVAARVLCSMCPEEALTHPDKKISVYETHQTNVLLASERVLSTDVLHRTSSEDKSKWSQGMNVNAFAFMFAQLLPPRMASAIARVMHAFKNKKVLLPESVVNLFRRQIKLRIDTYDFLKDDFFRVSESKHFVNIKDNVYMRTPTGMWQGILHYSSSLLHVLQTVHYKNMCKLHFTEANEKMTDTTANTALQDSKPLGTLIIDTVVSSDDSATYGSIILPQDCSPEIALKADQLLDFLLKLEVIHSRFYMMVESSKSTISSRTVGEFNSVFLCSKTYMSPVVKKVLSATTIPGNEDLENRQVVMSNSLKDILEEGACHYQVHIVELVNSFLHYAAFGLCTSRLFSPWTGMIVRHPDPHLGFLLLDLQDIAGTFGFDFKKYNSLIQTNVPVMPRNSSGSEESFSSGVVLTDRKKWLQFKDKVVSHGWEKYLEKHPHVLYLERGQTKEQIRARLSYKACSAGICESLNRKKSMSRLICSSVYLLAKRLLSVKQLDLIEDKTSKGLITSTREVSLLHLTQKHITAAENDDTYLAHCQLKPNQVNLFYPNNLLHRTVSQAVKAARKDQLIKTIRYRKVKCKVEVRSGSTNNTILPLITLVRWKWLSHPTPHAQTMLEYSWNRYTRVFTWLRETVEETLEASPFKSHIRLHGFIIGLDEKSSELNLLCRKLRTFSPSEQILELSSYNQYPQLRRQPEDEDQ